MITALFWTILRCIAIPIVAILLLGNSFLGEQGGFLAVLIALTIVNVFSILWQILKIFGNTLLFRGFRIIKLVLLISIEAGSLIFFWIYFLTKGLD